MKHVDDPPLPPIPARLSIVKLFLELSLYTPALLVLQGIMASDDQEVEAWYLEGWCFFLMAEQAKENGGKLDELTWEELARDARDCLETCQMVRTIRIFIPPLALTLSFPQLHITQEHPDAPLLEHTQELISKLESLGIQPSPDKDEDDGEEGWEDVDGSDDDKDVEMS